MKERFNGPFLTTAILELRAYLKIKNSLRLRKKPISLCLQQSKIYGEPNDEFIFILTTGRIRDQWHTMTKTGKVSRLMTHKPTPFLEINPIDAYKKGIKEGDLVDITSKNGLVRVKANITTTIKEGVVFLPMHWGRQLNTDLSRANNLTNTIVDPVSKEPDFKFTLVAVTKYVKPKGKIAIVGAGAAAFRFIQNYRELNTADEIVVFSKEENPFTTAFYS